MRIKTLKRYQEQAVANGRYHMDYARQQYDALLPDAGIEQREGIASHQGCLLLEAPTGSGKTPPSGRKPVALRRCTGSR